MMATPRHGPMCSQRVSDALVGIAVDTFYQCSGGVIGWNTARTVLEAVLAAEPTTPASDGLAERVEKAEAKAHDAVMLHHGIGLSVGVVRSNVTSMIDRIDDHRERLAAHDAALAEVRDEMQALRSEYSMHVMVPLDEYDRLAAVDPFASTPSAVPDAVHDVTKDRAHWFDRGYRAGARLAHDQPGEQP